MKIYSVIVTYNGERWIEKCLRSLLQSEHEIKAIVIDNASEDNTLRTIKEKYPEVYLIENRRNLGFGRVNNLGIQYALSQGADYVFLINQDAWIDPLMVNNLVNTMQDNRDFGILSPLHLDYEGRGIDPLFLDYLKNNYRLMSDVFLGRVQRVYEIDFVNAAVWLLSCHLMEEVGGFDPLFFMYGEDNDLCRRVKSHGYKIGVVPSAFAHHFHTASNGLTISLGKESNWVYSGFLYDLKNPERSFLRNLLGVSFNFLVRLERRLEIRDLKGLGAVLWAALRTACRIPVIRRHYKKSKLRGKHWL